MMSPPFPHVNMKYNFNMVPLTFQNVGNGGVMAITTVTTTTTTNTTTTTMLFVV